MKRSQIRCWKSYCSEPLDKIEHYEEALADNFVGWCMHHRREIQQDGTRVSRQELKDKDLYFHRPASELVFMRREEHIYLHHKGNTYMKGKHLSEETRKKMSEALKGKHHSAEHRHKIAEALKGIHWWNNGIEMKMSRACPGEGWTRGRLKFK